MSAKLSFHVLGWAKPHGEPFTACSSYLLSCGANSTVIVDCGHGATAALLGFTRLSNIGDVVITHLHPDHWMDLFCLRNALLASDPSQRVRLHVGTGCADMMRNVCSALDIGKEYFDTVFDIQTFGTGDTVTMPGMDLTFFRTAHGAPTHGFNVAVAGHVRLAHIADSGPFADLASVLGGAECLVAECNSPVARSADHMCAKDIVDLVREATGIRRICVTHYPLEARGDIRSLLERDLPGIDVIMAETGVLLHA